MISKIIRKIKSTAGFSLTELLTTIIIMGIVLTGITAGISTAARVYPQVKNAANAQTLMSTAVTAINADLRSATDISWTNKDSGTGSPTFYSGSRGYRMQFQNKTDSTSVGDDTYIVIQQKGVSGTSSSGTVPLVTSQTRGELNLEISNIQWFNDNGSAHSDASTTDSGKTGYFSYTIKVSTKSGGASSTNVTRTIYVRPAE